VDGAEDVQDLAVTAIAALDRAVSKGVLHRNNAARRKARLVKRLQASGQAPAPVAPAPSPKSSARTTRTRAASKR
jgi:hypothetical protein